MFVTNWRPDAPTVRATCRRSTSGHERPSTDARLRNRVSLWIVAGEEERTTDAMAVARRRLIKPGREDKLHPSRRRDGTGTGYGSEVSTTGAIGRSVGTPHRDAACIAPGDRFFEPTSTAAGTGRRQREATGHPNAYTKFAAERGHPASVAVACDSPQLGTDRRPARTIADRSDFHIRRRLALDSRRRTSGVRSVSARPVASLMILPQVHLRKPCYDFYFL